MLVLDAPFARLLQASAQRLPRVTWSPVQPVQGTLIRIALSSGFADDSTTVVASLAGESLHFERAEPSILRALGAIPIDVADSLPLSIIFSRQDSSDTLVLHIPVTKGKYILQQLRVAPRFGTEPDSALTARLESEMARAVAGSRAAHETRRLWSGAFVRPRQSRVTSRFGHGREFNGVVQSRHMGVDLAGPAGAPVRASNRGVVALVDTFYLGGRVVYIDHGAGLVTGYLHLSRTNVTLGDTVQRGQVIGHVGATGRVTGPHLHWIARYGSVTVDPFSLPMERPNRSKPTRPK